MAMITTRNIEYALFIASLIIILKATKIRSMRFLTGIALLGLLIASDKLFLYLSLGGALIALVAYSLLKVWNMVSSVASWLVATVGAGILALITLAVVNSANVLNIVGQTDTGPYGLTHGLHDIVLGSIYGVLGLLTNFGANPGYDATIVSPYPLTDYD